MTTQTIQYKITEMSVWSNGSFLMFGFLGLIFGYLNLFLMLIGFSLILLSYGSWAYHSIGTREPERFDEIGMYAVFNSLVAFALWNLHHYPSWIAMIIVPVITWDNWRDIDNINSEQRIKALMIVLYSLLILAGAWWTIGISLPLFGLAFLCRSIGQRYVVTDRPLEVKDEYHKWHGRWHIIACLAIVSIPITPLLVSYALRLF